MKGNKDGMEGRRVEGEREPYGTSSWVGLRVFDMLCCDLGWSRIESCEKGFCEGEFCHLESGIVFLSVLCGLTEKTVCEVYQSWRKLSFNRQRGYSKSLANTDIQQETIMWLDRCGPSPIDVGLALVIVYRKKKVLLNISPPTIRNHPASTPLQRPGIEFRNPARWESDVN
jgi:hypothetical protein